MFTRGKRVLASFTAALMVLTGTFGGVGVAYADPATDETAGQVSEQVIIEEVPFAASAIVDGVRIEVTADAGVFPADATLFATRASDDRAAEATQAIEEAEEAGTDVQTTYVFDISIRNAEGEEIQPDTSKGEVKVAFTAAEVANEDLELVVYHMNEDAGEGLVAEKLEAETTGETAVVETEGFSAYALRFVRAEAAGEYLMAYLDGAVSIYDILAQVGITDKTVSSLQKDTNAPIDIIGTAPNFKIDMNTETPTGAEHGLQVNFTDGSTKHITILLHRHNWDLKVNGDTATLKCTELHCPYSATYTTKIVSTDGNPTYNGQAHGARFETNTMPGDVHVSSIRFYNGSTQLSGTPVNAGTYRAEATISPDGGTAKVISTTYTINKADIQFAPEAAPHTLIYNGQNQGLYDLAVAKSSTTSQTFPVRYSYTGTSTYEVDTTLTGKDAGTYSISYRAVGDANHNDSEVKTLQVTIGTRAVVVHDIKANDRIYNSKTDATLNYSSAVVSQVVSGEALRVTATGTFSDKNAGANKTVTLSDLTLHAANAGTKASNYHIDTQNSQKTTTATIAPKEIRIDWENAKNFQYDGEPHAPTPVKRPGDAASDNDYLVYAGDEITVGVTMDSYQTEIGENYEAFVTNLGGADKDNYFLPDKYSSVGAKFNIVQKVLEVEWVDTVQEYDAKVLLPKATLKTPVEGEDVDVTVVMNKTSKNAGEYVATAILAGGDAENYALNALTMTSPFAITKAPLEIEASGWIYYGDRVSGNESIHELQFNIDESQFKGDDTQETVLGGEPRFETDYGSKYNLVDPVSDDAHTYYLFPHFETAENYEIDNEDGILTVYPKPVELAWTDTHEEAEAAVEGGEEYIYDGKIHTYSATVTDDSYVLVNGRRIGDVITVTLAGHVQRDANAKTGTDEYVPYATDLSDPNYALVRVVEDGKRTMSDVETRSIDFTIDQRPVELDWAPLEFVYNGEVQIPEMSITNLQTDDEGNKDAAFEIGLHYWQTTSYHREEREDESIEAGDYEGEVYYDTYYEEDDMYDLADRNYTLEDGEGLYPEWTIGQLPVELSWSADSLVYNAKEQQVDATFVNLIADDDAELVIEHPEAIDAGKYNTAVVDIDGIDGPNYTLEGVKTDHDWKITPASIKPAAVSGIETKVDNGKAQTQDKLVVKITLEGQELTLKKDKDYKLTYKNNTKPGTATVTITGIGNYKDSIDRNFLIKFNSAAIVNGHTYVITSAKDQSFAMDTAAGSFMSGANVAIYKRNNTEAQAFTLTKLSDGTWKILNYKGMTLDVKGGATGDKANVETYTWNNTDAQKYRITENEDGSITIINKKSGKALDVAGGAMKNSQNVQQYTSNKSLAQKWVLVDMTSKMTPKTYEGKKVVNSALSGYALDVAGASKNNGANVQIFKKNGSKAQTWTLTYRGDGLYSLNCEASGKVLDVKAGKAGNGSNVQQYSWNGSKAQLWKVVKNSDGSVTLRSAIDNNYVLDVANGKAANGQNVQLYKSNGTKAQKWTLG